MEKQCKIVGCKHKLFSRGLCNMHYLRIRRYGRYNRIFKKHNIDIPYISKTQYSREYSQLYRTKTNFKSLPFMNKLRFGGLREKAIIKGEEKCFCCGITRITHYKKYNRDLSVHHIDLNGRNSQTKNNTLKNLVPVCLSCHAHIHMTKHGMYSKLKKKGGVI